MVAVRFLPSLLIVTLSFPTLCSSQSDAEALIKFKASFPQGCLSSWTAGSGISPCLRRWFGERCHGEDIIGLHLEDLHLSGTIDVQPLLQLHYLRSISLMRNSFAGPIPPFNKLGALKSLYLSHNQFNGEIPDDYFAHMKSLKKVWLSENKFTGHVPDSVMKLPHLKELHLEGNHFTESIPPLKYPNVLTSFNVSFNHLEGYIPESFAKFSKDSFRGNAGLCGKPVTNSCLKHEPDHKAKAKSDGRALLFAITIFFLLCVLIASACSAKHGTEKADNLGVVSKQSVKTEALPVRLSLESIHKRSAEPSRRSKSGSKRDLIASKSGTGYMVIVNDERGEFGLQDLMKASAERMRGMNRLGKDEFDAEIRRFGKLKHRNILTPFAYHFRKEEKLIVSEYMPTGSLSFILHGIRDLAHASLNWPSRFKIIKGIVQGLNYIHTEFETYELPHGNLKSSNILLTERYDPLLSDYAFQPLTNLDNYAQVLFAYKSPEYVQYHKVSPKSDVYCLGIVILETMTGKYPSQYPNNDEHGVDIVQWVQTSISENRPLELIDPEIANNTSSTNKMLKVIEIGADCVEGNPDERLSLNEVITRIEEIS
ncbi:Leucine-rich repeat protein kinase family protein, putative isoform 2 [Hibiscus syriacus]|uniref:Leucine-rich repeat protein kinase family protein, putative isoform 2 n=1 Tax=Hibiscus syriacus TaxID=106335 RepID=A0A6A2Y4W0_HIBSY|nr:Leucine-rich repeat protein kinase family protein, putative isoform 2 [Hibiscus syriacus]